MKTVRRPWGLFKQFILNEKSTVKILEVKPKEELSLQSHKQRAEFWYVLEGNPTSVVGNKAKKFKSGESVKIGKSKKHRIINKSSKMVKVLEIATGSFDEHDEKRYEDKYNRS